MRCLVFAFLPFLAGGCFDSLLQQDPPTITPSGKIQAALGTGTLHTTPAVAHQKAEPMVVDGASSELTFSLTAADTLGGTALQDLKNAGDQAQLDIRTGGRNHLEVHLDGGGCVAVTGLVSLSLDSNTQLAGSFQADGMISGGMTACHISGTIAGVPLDR